MKRFFAFLLLPVLLLCGCQAEPSGYQTEPADPSAYPWGVGTLLETNYPAWVDGASSMEPGQVIICINTRDGGGLDPGNFLLTNAEGETLYRSDGETGGTMELFHSWSGLGSFGINYIVSDSDSFVFEPGDPSLNLYLKWSYGIGGVSVSGTNIRRAELQKNQITLFGENMSYDLGFFNGVNGDSMSMTGEGEQEAQMTSRKGQEQVLFRSLQAPFTVKCRPFMAGYGDEVTRDFSAGQRALASATDAGYTIDIYRSSVLPAALATGAVLVILAILLLLCRKQRMKKRGSATPENTSPAESPQDSEG